ncbi:glycosyltransferase family A protein [Leeuwenhoekiella sp. LLG6367-2.1]|uniref:glycosyltransferase family A protein n=1 Tax=Leeuwenhoekiella sp. LLG6367-2.1 TaxID=3160833 RepID=UPI003870C741
MRNGVNPEKFKGEVLPIFSHRVIVPVYIPNLKEQYYLNHLEVFEKFIDQLVKTINLQTTAITLINNNSCVAISRVIESKRAAIDKLVVYQENKGKVYPVLQEARAAAEPFITITDADVLFFKGWEEGVFNIFAKCPKAGVVAPLPSAGLAFYCNTAVFIDNFFRGKIQYDKFISDQDSEMYLYGMGNKALLDRSNRKYSWKERQYYLSGTDAIIGSGHFVATYKGDIFKNSTGFPKLKFKNGLEEDFIDILSDRKGYYRLSTRTTYAYHMGNTLVNDQIQEAYFVDSKLPGSFFDASFISSRSSIPFIIRKHLFSLIKKIFKL